MALTGRSAWRQRLFIGPMRSWCPDLVMGHRLSGGVKDWARHTFHATAGGRAMADWKWSRHRTGRCRPRLRVFSKVGVANRPPVPSPNIRLSPRRRLFGMAGAVGVVADDRRQSSRTGRSSPAPIRLLHANGSVKEYHGVLSFNSS